MTNVAATIKQLATLGGGTNEGLKFGFIDSGAKAAQNDTWTCNCGTIVWACPTVDATGATGTYTVATNVITLTSATTGAHSAFVVYI
jgi:hypothetical protein